MILLAAVDPLAIVALLAGGPPHHLVSRHVDHPDHARAREVLVETLEAFDGLSVDVVPVLVDGYTDLANVIVDVAGQDPSLPWLVIGAHYDSIADRDLAWVPASDPAPGADDDASGCAVLVAVAEHLMRHPPVRPVRLVWFDGEEVGLLGSRDLAQRMRDQDVDIESVLVFDPVGFDAAEAHLFFATYDARWPGPAQQLVARAAGTGFFEAHAVDRALIGGDARSDHAPFWDAGYPAVHVGSFPQPPVYHTMDDTIAGVSPAYLTAMTEVVLAEVTAVAGVAPQAAPGCGCRTGERSLWWPLCLLFVRRTARTAGKARVRLCGAGCQASAPPPTAARRR